MRKSKLLLFLSLLLPIMVGLLSALLTSLDMELYQGLEKPPLSPPAIVFPIVWTILYLLMGAASYLAITSNASGKQKLDSTSWYLIQLIMNFLWSILFFNMKLYLFSLIWLAGMFLAIIICTVQYYRMDKRAGWLMIPYNLWMVFAAYLNLSIVIMNK